MTILNDTEISEFVSRGILISENFFDKGITPNGYDFRASKIRVDGNDLETIELDLGKYALVSSMEYFAMPKDVIGNIWIRSSFARRGIIGSFGVIDAGYHGNITVGLYNAGDQIVKLESGE
ncbi:MAG: dCTP deaminase domain-containing protein, partial [Thermoplasmataceae archaeon]